MEALSEKLFDSLARIPRHYYVPIGIGILGLIFFGVGLIQLIGSANTEKVQKEIPQTSLTTQISPTTALSGITVDVEGAVVAPGVYTLPFSSRLKDVLVAAGGLSAEADREYIAQHVNLAAKVSDGAKVYIPSVTDVTQQDAVSSLNNAVTEGVLGTQTGLININTASEKELDSLPGIGSVTVGKIIAGRPFSSIEDLLTKKIVKQSVFDKIKDSLTVN